MKGKYFFVVLVIFITLTFFITTCNNGNIPNRNHTFLWVSIDGEITITGYKGPGGNVTIPALIGDEPVTAIGMNAF